MCDMFDREIVSKPFIQLRIRNKGRPSMIYVLCVIFVCCKGGGACNLVNSCIIINILFCQKDLPKNFQKVTKFMHSTQEIPLITVCLCAEQISDNFQFTFKVQNFLILFLVNWYVNIHSFILFKTKLKAYLTLNY